jgi:DNA-binding beta-propeller fold protein YncE
MNLAMALQLLSTLQLPAHLKPGGFDHAAYYCQTGWLYVAHTANDSLDVIDCASDTYLRSIPNLGGVAGALANEERGLVFTSNRAENTVGIFSPANESDLTRVPVGLHPNGLAFDPGREILLAANVGDPEQAETFTLSVVDVDRREMIHSISVPGRTRWAIFDPWSDAYYINIARPALILVVPGRNPSHVAASWPLPVSGPHGLDLDDRFRRLYCACDGRTLLVVDLENGAIQGQSALSGSPDVLFFNSALRHLYVASGQPGCIDVFDMNHMALIETVATGRGAHTLGFDSDRNKVYAFLPQSHSALAFQDTG